MISRRKARTSCVGFIESNIRSRSVRTNKILLRKIFLELPVAATTEAAEEIEVEVAEIPEVAGEAETHVAAVVDLEEMTILVWVNNLVLVKQILSESIFQINGVKSSMYRVVIFSIIVIMAMRVHCEARPYLVTGLNL